MSRCLGYELVMFLSLLSPASGTIFHDDTHVFWEFCWQAYYEPISIMKEFLQGQRTYYERKFGIATRCKNTSKAELEDEEEIMSTEQSQRSLQLQYDPFTLEFYIKFTIPFVVPIYNPHPTITMRSFDREQDARVASVSSDQDVSSETAEVFDDGLGTYPNFVDEDDTKNLPLVDDVLESSYFLERVSIPSYEENQKNRSLVTRGDTRLTARTFFYQDSEFIFNLEITFWTEDSLQDVLWRFLSAASKRSFLGHDFLAYMDQWIGFCFVIDIPFTTPFVT